MSKEDLIEEIFAEHMKINDVIAVLKGVRAEHGDIDCVVGCFDGNDYHEANRFQIVNVKHILAETRRHIDREALVKAAHAEGRNFPGGKVVVIGAPCAPKVPLAIT